MTKPLRRHLRLKPPLPYPKIVALKNIDQYLIPELRFKEKDENIIQILPSTKYVRHQHSN